MQTAASKQNQKNGLQLPRAYATAERAPTQVLGEKKYWITRSRDNKDDLASAHAHKTKKTKSKHLTLETHKRNTFCFLADVAPKFGKRRRRFQDTNSYTHIHTHTEIYIVFLLFLSSFKKKRPFWNSTEKNRKVLTKRKRFFKEKAAF